MAHLQLTITNTKNFKVNTLGDDTEVICGFVISSCHKWQTTSVKEVLLRDVRFSQPWTQIDTTEVFGDESSIHSAVL
jgi:hypothetical protein